MAAIDPRVVAADIFEGLATGAALAAHDVDFPLDAKTRIPVDPNGRLVLRQLRSRKQLNRAGNHLRNCLPSMYGAIKSGATAIIIIELDAHPLEAIELDPVTRSVKQWMGKANGQPDLAVVVQAMPVLNRLGVTVPPGVIGRIYLGAQMQDPF